jgi:dihydroorotase (multifunctional complex type)
MGWDHILVDLTIINAKILTDHGLVKGGVAINDGKIYSIEAEERLPKAATTINAQGNLVLPGLIDVHTHLRDLNLEYKEDFYSGTCAALAGGFTTVLDMPNTLPLTDNSLRLREKMAVANRRIVANTGFYTCFPAETEELKKLKNLGAMGCKVFLHHPNTALDVDDDDVLLHTLHILEDLDMILAVHAEDRYLIENLRAKYKAAATPSPNDHSKTHPPQAEVKAVQRILSLIRRKRPRLHFCHISTGETSSLISQAKAEGLPVTYEVTPHHLLLSETLLTKVGSLAFVDPPLRHSTTQRGLWQDLLTGSIDLVASDHAPHSLKEKRHSDIWAVPSGFPGLETTLPLLLTMVARGKLSLELLIAILARNPARIFRLDGKGVIAVGFDADLTVVDVDQEFIIDSTAFHSKAKYSPFDGMKVVGRPIQVFLGGNLVMEEGEILSKPGSGSIIRPSSPKVG